MISPSAATTTNGGANRSSTRVPARLMRACPIRTVPPAGSRLSVVAGRGGARPRSCSGGLGPSRRWKIRRALSTGANRCSCRDTLSELPSSSSPPGASE